MSIGKICKLREVKDFYAYFSFVSAFQFSFTFHFWPKFHSVNTRIKLKFMNISTVLNINMKILITKW